MVTNAKEAPFRKTRHRVVREKAKRRLNFPNESKSQGELGCLEKVFCGLGISYFQGLVP